MDKNDIKNQTRSMTVKILNINEGLIEYENVKYIRIKSRYYNLMIMIDYLPIIGEIEGDIKFELINDTIKLNNIKGYFMNKKNQFNLFIKEVLDNDDKKHDNSIKKENITKKQDNIQEQAEFIQEDSVTKEEISREE